MKNKNILAVVLFMSLIGLIFHNWFILNPLSSGDWLSYFPETLRDFPILPAWDTLNNGLGQSTIPFLWLQSYFLTTAKFAAALPLPWILIERIFWFWPFLIASILSSFILSRQFFSGIPIHFSLLAAFFYTVNTYSLMIVDGGQMGIALAYSIAPLVLARFVKLINYLSHQPHDFHFLAANWRIKLSIIAALIFALQVMLDIRIAYITMLVISLYGLFHYFFIKQFNIKHFIFYFLFSIFIILGLHAYWILPLLFFQINPQEQVSSIFTAREAVSFFSFADFSHTFSLLHPNWPENIFGKVYFMKSEFLLLPIFTFSSLLFIKSLKLQLESKNLNNNVTIEQLNNRAILFFTLIGLLGTFLAKGTNPPFGEVYLWLFESLPGFFMFRDPTKFYLLISLSYAVLIPFSIFSILNLLSSKLKFQNYLPNLFLLLVTCYFLLLMLPASLGELNGTIKSHEVPKEYVELKDFLHDQPEFFRTLWIPQRQRFGYFSFFHPAVAVSEVSEKLLIDPESKGLLQDRGVKYIIVPSDSEKELFLTDRKYDERLRKSIEKHLDKIAWLRKIDSPGNILVYEVTNQKDRFWILGKGQILSWDGIKPSTYRVSFQGNPGARLIFSDRFDSLWEARVDGETMQAENIRGMNGFAIANSNTHTAIITYAPQAFVYYGLFISIAIFLLSTFLFLRKH